MGTRIRDDVSSAKAPMYPIESVDNVLRLLLLLSERRRVRVSEAAAELGTAVSTAHRLLAMLVHHGFALQDPESKVYRVGPILLRAGLLATRDLDLRTAVQPHLEGLRDETGETAHAAVLQGNQMLFIACAESPHALRVTSRVGTLMWAHCTSIGKAWLAGETDEFLRWLYPTNKLPALTDRSITSRTTLMNQVKAIRRAGYASNIGESDAGVGSVSVACQRDGRPLVSISVAIPLARVSVGRWDELVESLVKTSRAVESALL